MDCEAILKQRREGPWVFVGTEDAVKVWNTQTGNELTLLGPVELVRALATADDTLFAGTQDGAILAWKFRSENEPPELIASLKGCSRAIICLAIGANKIYSGSMDNRIRDVLGLCGLNDAEAEPVLLCSCHGNYVRLYDLPTFAKTRSTGNSDWPSRHRPLFFTGDTTGHITVWKFDAELKKQTSSSSS